MTINRCGCCFHLIMNTINCYAVLNLKFEYKCTRFIRVSVFSVAKAGYLFVLFRLKINLWQITYVNITNVFSFFFLYRPTKAKICINSYSLETNSSAFANKFLIAFITAQLIRCVCVLLRLIQISGTYGIVIGSPTATYNIISENYVCKLMP